MKKIMYPILVVVVFMMAQTLTSMVIIMPAIIDYVTHGMSIDPQGIIGNAMTGNKLAAATLISGILTVVVLHFMKVIDWSTFAKRINRAKIPSYLFAAAFGIFACDLIEEMLNLPNLCEQQMIAMVRTPLGALTVGIVGPICEELIFREGILGYLSRNGVKPWVAIVASALVFGVIHANPAQILFAAAIGVMLGYIYLRTGNIIIPAIIHILNNSIAVWQMNVMADSADDASLVEAIGGIPVAICVAVACVLLCIWMFRATDKNVYKKSDCSNC